jgi:hypothetical protein
MLRTFPKALFLAATLLVAMLGWTGRTTVAAIQLDEAVDDARA